MQLVSSPFSLPPFSALLVLSFIFLPLETLFTVSACNGYIHEICACTPCFPIRWVVSSLRGKFIADGDLLSLIVLAQLPTSLFSRTDIDGFDPDTIPLSCARNQCQVYAQAFNVCKNFRQFHPFLCTNSLMTITGPRLHRSELRMHKACRQLLPKLLTMRARRQRRWSWSIFGWWTCFKSVFVN